MQEYLAVVDYLFHQLPMFQKDGKSAYKKDLSRITELCNILGNPQENFESVHVAGTNGKGSVSHALSAMLMTSNRKVGLYTSPHYVDFRERIQVNGGLINKEYIIDFVNKYKDAFEKVKPSFFEWSVALSFAYFRDQKVDVAVIETGLGGRLDSTNIIHPLLSIITNVGMDHTDILGDTLHQIAREKAGIIKPKTPILIGERNDAYFGVIEEIAEKRNAPLLVANDQINVITYKESLQESQFRINLVMESKNLLLSTDLCGRYQLNNLKICLSAIYILRKKMDLNIDEAIKGLKNVRKRTNMLGRWQVISSEPPTILDGAHNADAIGAVIHQFNEIESENQHIVLGLSKGKDIEKILECMPKSAHYYICNAPLPRAIPATELHDITEAKGLHGNYYPSPKQAYDTALKNASEFDTILVTGSIFIIGEILKK